MRARLGTDVSMPSSAPRASAIIGDDSASRRRCSALGAGTFEGSLGDREANVMIVAEALRGYLQYLVVERGLAANTVQSYRRDLRRYSAVLAGRGKTRLADITPGDVAEFLASLREGDAEHAALAVSSAARAVIAVRGLHAFAVAQGLTETDPAREVPPPPPPRRLPKAIPIEEVE